MYETMLLISQAVQSNLPLGEAIRLLVNGDERKRINRDLLRFASLLDEGLEPQVAVRQAKLPRRLTALLETAFKSGNFPEYFAELTEIEQNRSKTFQTLINLMAYPFLLLGVMLIVYVLMLFIVPRFEAIFRDFDMTLPAMTEMLITFSKVMSQPVTYLILIIGVIVLIFLQLLLFSSFWFYIPILGNLFRSLASQKLLRQLLFSIRRGLPMDQALELAAGSFSLNWSYRKYCLQAAAFAKEGTPFSLIISFFPLLFPRWLVPFVQVAEKKATLPSVLKHGIIVLEKEQSTAAFLFHTIFMPVIWFILLSFIPFIFLALMMPLVKLITALSG